MELLRVAGIQTSLHWEDTKANYAMLENKLMQIKDVDLVVLPEMFSTGFSMNTNIASKLGDEPLMWMKKQSSALGFALAGSYMIQEGENFYNRLSLVTPEGEITSYDKKHLFSLAGEHYHFTAGTKQVMVTYKGWKIALMICYDLRFAVWCRRSPTFNYDAIIFVANWPDRRSHAWRSLLLARAIENQAYVMGVNRVGVDGQGIVHSGESAIIDPLGKYLHTAAPFVETVIYATLHKSVLHEIRQRLPFFDDRDEFLIIK